MQQEQVKIGSNEVKALADRLKAAQAIGRAASTLEREAKILRRTIDQMGIESLKAPEGHTFGISVTTHEGILTIEPYISGADEWGDSYRPDSANYEHLVKKSGWGDDASMTVNTIDYESSTQQIWGYDFDKGIRVLINDHVAVRLVECPTAE
jgi:hypothetical protein